MGLDTLGNLLLAFASICALGSIVAAAMASTSGKGARPLATYLTYGTLAFTTLAVVLVVSAFLGENFTLEYVAYNHPTIVGPWAWLFRISGLWAGREGSLLLWEWLVAVYAAYVGHKALKHDDGLGFAATGVLNFIQLFFLAALFIPLNNPFKLLPPEYLDPQTGRLLIEAGMNPLLQTWAMIAHPPTLFVGYAGLAVPFAFALAALFLGDASKRWVQMSDRITVFSWLMLGVGIGLGAIWAYIELAFGGYWAWDPVENASLLPWLTGVALIHSMTVYRRREGFKGWTMFMSAVTFVVVLLGTFITRSGIVQSVHAFEQDPLSFWLFLSMMVGSLVVMVGAIWWRRDMLRGDDSFERVLSKEGSYYFNNLIMLLATLLVAYMTLAQSLPVWLGGGKTYGIDDYNLLARPLGIFYILVMTVCPILSWGGQGWAEFWKRAKGPLVGGLVLFAGLMAIFFRAMLPYYQPAGEMAFWHHLIAVAGLLTAALAIALPLFLFYDGARKRAAARGESFFAALGRIITKARTQSGGYLTHLGMGIILVGLVGSTMFVETHELTVATKPGSSTEAHGYTFTVRGLNEATEPNGDVVYTFELDAKRGSREIGVLKPKIVFPIQLQSKNQSTQKVALIQEPLKDVFVSFHGVDDNDAASVTVKFFPMQWWVWTGFIVTIIGTALASWPKRQLQAA
ncbi:cytochrome c biogenesis protein CcsA [Coriobacteriia bacterium Es71-Z0120]|uniref:heme lyase CcmF/NrfE family subunit n=1 Tax=Parvivirga hydrogeniphila TaxID=2939460 RepID=UPI002260ECBB|nr:cytochrome c biogenesis protein CcsA [Parvivirga hydrogeniphila]MCL4079368.1 cytochrome c biogenesis protein CcsA [Parvivirga hydrogeniphila]